MERVSDSSIAIQTSCKDLQLVYTDMHNKLRNALLAFENAAVVCKIISSR